MSSHGPRWRTCWTIDCPEVDAHLPSLKAQPIWNWRRPNFKNIVKQGLPHHRVKLSWRPACWQIWVLIRCPTIASCPSSRTGFLTWYSLVFGKTRFFRQVSEILNPCDVVRQRPVCFYTQRMRKKRALSTEIGRGFPRPKVRCSLKSLCTTP